MAHFAIMDTLIEHGINPDVIVGCSSGALVAVAYGAGTRDFLFDYFMTMDRKRLFRSVSWRGARGGLFHLHGGDGDFQKLSKGLKLQDLPIKIGVTAADIENGDLHTLTTGDIILALKASMAVPGVFEPVIINNRILLEGGLVNVVPTVPVRQLGADIVIGVDVAKTKFFFQETLPLFRLIRRLRRILGIQFVHNGIIKPIASQFFDNGEKKPDSKKKMPNCLRIFFWAVDRSYDVEKEWHEENQACDIMIEPDVKETPYLEMKQGDFIYKQGRKAALEALPRIKEIIAQYEVRGN